MVNMRYNQIRQGIRQQAECCTNSINVDLRCPLLMYCRLQPDMVQVLELTYNRKVAEMICGPRLSRKRPQADKRL